MDFKRPPWYTAKALADYWKKPIDIVHLYHQSGKLKLEKMYCYEGNNTPFWLPEDHDTIDEQVTFLEGGTFVGAYYKLQEVERFEEKEGITVPHAQDKYPSLLAVEKNEKAISGLSAIAKYLDLTPDYLKRSWKNNGYPFNKGPKKLYAYPSQLKVWRSLKTKK